MKLLATAVMALAAAPAAAVARPPARAVLVDCDRPGHAATFEARVNSVPGAERMAVRFLLQDREPGDRWRRVRMPGFSAWHTSDPGRSRYVYTRRVERLVGPAAYRVVVRFRWLDAAGDVLRGARARSRACRMPDPRPDLRVAALTVRGLRTHYAVTVRNAGRSKSGRSLLRLDLGDGRPPLTAEVGALRAWRRQTVVLAGRACTPGSLLTATADATNVVDERDEGDNALVATCPA